VLGVGVVGVGVVGVGIVGVGVLVPPFCKSVIIEANSPRLSVGPVYVG
jgi:hypothetical protein